MNSIELFFVAMALIMVAFVFIFLLLTIDRLQGVTTQQGVIMDELRVTIEQLQGRLQDAEGVLLSFLGFEDFRVLLEKRELQSDQPPDTSAAEGGEVQN